MLVSGPACDLAANRRSEHEQVITKSLLRTICRWVMGLFRCVKHKYDVTSQENSQRPGQFELAPRILNSLSSA